MIFVILGHRFVQTCTCSLVRISTHIHYLIPLMRRFGSVEREGTLSCNYAVQRADRPGNACTPLPADAGCSWSFRPMVLDVSQAGIRSLNER